MFEWLFGKKKKPSEKVANPETKPERKSGGKPSWDSNSEHRSAPEFENECECECDDHDCFEDEDCDECDCHDDEWWEN